MWILNYFPMFCVLFFAGMILCFIGAFEYDIKGYKKKSTVYSVFAYVFLFLVLACFSFPCMKSAEEYETPESHKVYIRQVGNSNMFVGTRYSGNDVAKYQVLTENGEYREFNARSTRIIFAKVKKPYIQVYKVQYTKFLGKLAQSQFEGRGYNYKYAYSLVVPEDSVDSYVRISY